MILWVMYPFHGSFRVFPEFFETKAAKTGEPWVTWCAKFMSPNLTP